MGLKKIELVLENCEVAEFNPRDVMVEFSPVRYAHMFELGYSILVRDVIITIRKDAKAKGLWEKTWQKRLKTPDITAIYLDETRFAIDEWPDKEEYNNPYQHFYEDDKQIRILISSNKKFIKKYALRMTRR